MIDLVTWETAHQLGDVLPAMLRLRHRIFVKRQGYTVPTHQDMEWDQFDTPTAVYLCWRDDQNQPRGVVRLLPTNRPYMIKELWPHLIDGDRIPADSSIWEWTRFGVDRDLDAATRTRVVGELLCACMEFALKSEISGYLFVTPKHAVKAYKRYGMTFEPLGREQDLGGVTITVCRLAVSSELLKNLRKRYGIKGRILHAPETPAPSKHASRRASAAQAQRPDRCPSCWIAQRPAGDTLGSITCPIQPLRGPACPPSALRLRAQA